MRAPLGVVYPPQEQGPNQVHNIRENRIVENNSEYDRILNPLETQNGRPAPRGFRRETGPNSLNQSKGLNIFQHQLLDAY